MYHLTQHISTTSEEKYVKYDALIGEIARNRFADHWPPPP